MPENKFIGPFEVIGIEETDIKTPLGKEVIRVSYSNRPPGVMPKTAYNLLLTNKPVEPTPTQEKRFNLLIPKIIEQMAEYDVSMMEVQPFFTYVYDVVTSNFERASSFRWTGDDKNWIPGMSYENNITIVQIDSTLKTINKDNDVTKKQLKADNTGEGV